MAKETYVNGNRHVDGELVADNAVVVYSEPSIEEAFEKARKDYEPNLLNIGDMPILHKYGMVFENKSVPDKINRLKNKDYARILEIIGQNNLIYNDKFIIEDKKNQLFNYNLDKIIEMIPNENKTKNNYFEKD